MKYCKQCKTEVNPHLKHCPLCGSFLEECVNTTDELQSEEKIQSKISYPSLVVESKYAKNFIKKKLFWLLALLFAVCVVINWLTYSGSLWAGYVLFGLFVVYFAVINSVYRRRRLYSMLGTGAFLCSVCVLGFDIVHSLESASNLTMVAISVEYVIPSILVAAILASDVFIFLNRSKYKYFFVSLMGASVAALLPQLCMWIFRLPLNQWLSFSAFAFAIFNLLVMILAFWTIFKREMLRKFNL